MNNRAFFKSGNTPTLFSAFLYFDLSFMVWVILGPLGVSIGKAFHLDPAQKGLVVAIPVLSGAVFRIVAGVLVDHIGPKLTGILAQSIVIVGLLTAWFLGVHNYDQVLTVGLLLGVAGASFAIALPLASRWYPPEYQGLALGIAGAGNSGTALAALFAPSLAQHYGWNNVLGLAAIPLAVAFAVFLIFAKDAPSRPPAKTFSQYLGVLATADAWWMMLFYFVTFGGFVGLSTSLTIYFNSEYGLSAVVAGFFTAACVFGGSLVRPLGGFLADRFGGVRTLSVVYVLAAIGLAVASFKAPNAYLSLAEMMFSMMALGMGNGAVFQIVPQRFGKEMGVITGLVGATGGAGGFYLASSLGWAKKATGSYQDGLLAFAGMAVVALIVLTLVKSGWRRSWLPTSATAGAPTLMPALVA